MKKRIVSVLAAMVIVFAVGVIPAFADGGAGGGTIEIHKTANLSFAGSTFSAYKIFDLTTSVSGEDTAYAYTLNPAFNGFPIPSGFADLKAYLEDQTSDSVAMNAVAKDLYNYITGHGVPAAASYTVNGSADANIIMISADGSGTGTIIDQYITLGGPQYNKTVPSPGHIEWVPIPGAYLGGPLGFGYYLVYSTGVASGNITVVAACTLTTVSPKAEVHPKMDGPKLTKTVYNEEADAWGNTADANIGDVLHFSLDSAVPVTTGYDEYVYTIHDDLSAGLTLDESSINVTVGGRDVTGDYTLNTATQGTAPADGCTFEIVFDSDQFLSYPIGDAIKVTYSATLNENAAVADLNDIMYALANGYARNPNDAWLDYSTNPYDTSKKASTPPNHVDVYTYMVNVKKVIEGTNAPLSGATFALFKSEADARAAISNPDDLAKALTFHTQTVTNSAAAAVDPGKEVTVCTPSDEGVAVVGVSKDGLLKFNGLDNGTYYLVEIAAPAGYNKLTDPAPVVINCVAPKAPPAPAGGIAPASMTLGSAPDIIVKNSSGAQLPETGGIGTTLFTAAGVALLIVAALLALLQTRGLSRAK